jgi:hypothetical protein
MKVREGDVVKVKYRILDQDEQDSLKLYIRGPLGIVIDVRDNFFYYLILLNEAKQEDFLDGFKKQLIYKDADNNFDTDYKYADLRYIYRADTVDNEPSGHLKQTKFFHLKKGFDFCQRLVEQDDFYPKLRYKK